MSNEQTMVMRFPKKNILKENDKVLWIDTKMTPKDMLTMIAMAGCAEDRKAVVFDPEAGKGKTGDSQIGGEDQ